jgi:hypothetical protein
MIASVTVKRVGPGMLPVLIAPVGLAIAVGTAGRRR